MSYTQLRYVTETQSRLERRVVQRPVVETQTREERCVVQRPVTETSYRDQVSTTLVPNTTYRQQVVDNGQFVNQFVYQPGPVRNRLRWLPGQCEVDPLTGQTAYRRGGLHWVPTQGAGSVQAQQVYVPNPVVQQIAETSLVPQQVVQRVPVQVTRMQQEVQVRQVPVQTVRMVSEEEFRQVPVTVQRPVTERIERQVPVEVCRWEPEQMVRRIPVTTCRMTYEDRVEQIPVRTCRMVEERRTVQVPTSTCRLVSETSMRRVARTVLVKIPIDPCTGLDLTTSITGSDSTPMLESTEQPSTTTLRPVEEEPEPTPAKTEQQDQQEETEPESDTSDWETNEPAGTRPIVEERSSRAIVRVPRG
jgi:hypothetical protein